MRTSIIALVATAAALLSPGTGSAFGLDLPCDETVPIFWAGEENAVVTYVGCPAAVVGGAVGFAVAAPPAAILATLGAGEGRRFSRRFFSIAGSGMFVGGNALAYAVLVPIHLPKWLIFDPLADLL